TTPPSPRCQPDCWRRYLDGGPAPSSVRLLRKLLPQRWTFPGLHRRASALQASALRVVERLRADGARHPPSEHLHLSPSAHLRRRGGQQRVGDAALDGKAVATRGHTTDYVTANADRFIAQSHRPRILEDEAGEARTIVVPGTRQGLSAEEPVRLVHPHCKSQPGLEWRDLRGDVGRPHPVALLQAQAVDRPV